jgi:hypothetical protein
MSDQKKLTTTAGCPVAHNQNVMTAGPRGPQLLQDVWFLEKLARSTGNLPNPPCSKGGSDRPLPFPQPLCRHIIETNQAPGIVL